MIQKIKKTFRFIAFFLSLSSSTIYTKDTPETDLSDVDFQAEQTSASIDTTQEIELAKLEAKFETVQQHSNIIYSSLLQLENAIEQDFIDYTKTNISKDLFLQEINLCKTSVVNYYYEYMDIDFEPKEDCLWEKIAIGTLFNKAMVNYLLACTEKDITSLSGDGLDNTIIELIESINNTESDLYKNPIDFDDILAETNVLVCALLENIINFIDANMSSTLPLISQKDDSELFKDKDFQQIQSLFDVTKAQSNAILYCLQQLEQVLRANKISFDESSISKKKFLQEIESIKTVLQKNLFQYSTQPAPEGIIFGSLYNKSMIQYLLDCINNDFSTLNNQKIESLITDVINLIHSSSQTDLDTNLIIKENEVMIKALKKAVDEFGLTTINKAFRYIENQPISWLGNATFMQATKNLTFYGTLGTAICVAGIYWATPFNYETSVDQHGNPIYTAKDVSHFNFINSICKNIGSLQAVSEFKTTNHPSLKILAKESFGLIGKLDQLYDGYNSGFLSAVAVLIISNSKESYTWLSEKSYKAVENLHHYLLGKVDSKSHSMFETDLKPVYFKDMIGVDHLEKRARQIADFVDHPERYESTGTAPSTGILLIGPSQTGKSLFAQALCTLISESSERDCPYLNVTTPMVQRYGLNYIFQYARNNAPFVLFIDEIDMLGSGINRDTNPEITGALLTNMSGLQNDKSKPVIVVAATNRPEKLDFALKQHGRFGTVIQFEYPSYENRKQQLINSLAKRNINILSNDYIDTMAQETEGESYNTIEAIIACAVRESQFACRPITQQDFENALDEILRGIQQNSTMSTQDKNIVATYHAGQAAARHILSTPQQVVKITINPVNKELKNKEGHEFKTISQDSISENHEHITNERIRGIKLGHVFTRSASNNKELISDSDFENELLALLAGQAALELLIGQMYNEFGKEDRAYILHMIEKRISQGSIVSEAMRQQALIEKDKLYTKIKSILTKNTDFIKNIKNALLQHSTIDRYQWAELVKKYRK